MLFEGAHSIWDIKLLCETTTKFYIFFQKFMVVNPDVDVGFNSDNDIFLNILLLILVLSIVAKMLQKSKFLLYVLYSC